MKVKVTRDIHVWFKDKEISEDEQGNNNVFYPAGFEGTAPRPHIDYIVKRGAGERIGGANDEPPAGKS